LKNQGKREKYGTAFKENLLGFVCPVLCYHAAKVETISPCGKWRKRKRFGRSGQVTRKMTDSAPPENSPQLDK
jgi:hypothetical protein